MASTADPRPPLYPVFRDVAESLCVVVGGGPVAARKCQDLARCGARVRVVSPEFCPAFDGLETLERVAEPYQARWLEGAVIVIAATDAGDVNRRVYADARRFGAWVNVVDQPALCDFHVPATVRRGPIQIAVSTGGASPALSRQVRLVLEQAIDASYGQLAGLIGEVRARVLRDVRDPEARRLLLEQFASPEWLQRLRRQGPEATRQAMQDAIAARAR